jgi:hypothetical protein
MRRLLSSVLLVLGGVLLFLALPAGYVNRTVLDAPTFADRVDELRRRDEVAQVLGDEVAQQLIARNPDLVAIAPLVQTVARGVMGGDALSGPTRVAAVQVNEALTTGNSQQVVLRIADAGAVVAGVLGAVAPERAPAATDVAATLSTVGSQDWASGVVDIAGTIDTLAWLLPVLTLLCLAGAVLLQPDRWNGLRRTGWSVVVAAGVLAVIVVAGGALVTGADGSERTVALVNGVWDIFVRPMWWPIGVLGAVGVLMVMIGSGRASSWNASALTGWVTARPTTTAGSILRAVAFIVVGLATVFEPVGMVTLFAFVSGVLLVVAGVGALAGLAEQAGARAGERSTERTGLAWLPLAGAATIGLLVLGGLAVWAGRPPETEVAGAVDGVVTGTGEVCNGHAELCDRRFDEVSYAATHNSMSVAGKPGWYLGEQGVDILLQLDGGTRALLVDVWYGRDAGGGRVRTSARSYEEALQISNEVLGPEVTQSALRVVDAIAPGDLQGPEALFMCHGLCETGATSFDDTLRDLRVWLNTHPDEVLTIFVEDHVDAVDVGASVEAAGLADYVYTPVKGQPFATLGAMIRSGRRLVVMLEDGDGRPVGYPWLVNGFEFVQETPYDFPTVESFSCAENRGDADAPLFQINHWLAGFTSLVSDAQEVNTADVLGTRVEQCRSERGLQPTFVAVNYADIGDLIPVVDHLNGVD